MKEKMPKVVPLKKSDAVETLKTMLAMAEAGQIKNFVAAGFMDDQGVFTAVIGTDPIEHHTLVGYLNANAIMRTVRADCEE